MRVPVILAALFTVTTATSVEKFTGEWLPIVTFPNIVTQPICDKYNMSVVGSDACICGSLKATLIKAEKGVTDIPALSIIMPIIIVDTYNEVEPALNLTCECGQVVKRHGIYRAINEDSYVMYERHPQNFYSIEEPNTANLLVKEMPTAAELRKLLESIPDLKNRSTGVMCRLDNNHRP